MHLIGLKEIRRTTRGEELIVNFIGDDGDLGEALRALIRQLPLNAELSSIEVSPAECFHEVRATNSGLELKRGCHGAHGTWKACTEDEAVEWVLPGLEAVTSNPRLGACVLSISACG